MTYVNGKKQYDITKFWDNTTDLYPVTVFRDDFSYLPDAKVWCNDEKKCTLQDGTVVEKDAPITPRIVLDNKALFPTHMKRIQDADYKKYPPMLTVHGGEISIADGAHRIAHFLLGDEEQLDAFVIPEDVLETSLVPN
jgi:hypothetical protein